MAAPTVERLRELVHYDPETGLFTCRVARRNRLVGDVENHLCAVGYVGFCVDGRQYLAHRLAWFYVHGEWPNGEIDHINGVRTDNRIANLRVASRDQNCWNSPIRRDNRSGFKGVFPAKKRWQAQIRLFREVYHLGTFDTPEEAHAAYCDAADRLHGGVAGQRRRREAY